MPQSIAAESPTPLAGAVASLLKVVPQIGVTRAEKAVGAHDREAHRVLVAVADAPRQGLAAPNAIEAGVAGDKERVVADPKRMNMAGSGIG